MKIQAEPMLRLPEYGMEVPIYSVHTLVLGSGAAGLNAAVQLRRHGVTDVLIVTEGFDKGTSVNTGSDKQTYYKTSLYGAEADSPLAMAEALFAGGSMHGDLALVEAAYSARAFMNLVELGVDFPRDRFGQFVGYKTDHDPRQRATSVGPHTSQEMCRALRREIERLGIPVHENRVAIALLTIPESGGPRAAGLIVLNLGEMLGRSRRPIYEIYRAENTILAVGGPGGLYEASVYPETQTGAIGLALEAGASARNLPESQFGLASVKFRWNVSGTYMQAIPRFFSTEADGRGKPREFLLPFFATPGDLNTKIFLKGYQWPFDPKKVIGGSSLIDLLVYRENVRLGRRVFLDFTRDSQGFSLAELDQEAHTYLERSGALRKTPLARLARMNPAAVELYREHGIDLASEPLEIAVCAQHNNGGLAGNLWWESVNIKHLFPVGEVNGTHGVYRPGGSALNAGQVGGFRAAEFIAQRYLDRKMDLEAFNAKASGDLRRLIAWGDLSQRAPREWREERASLRRRMSQAAAQIRNAADLRQALAEARRQWAEMESQGCGMPSPAELAESFSTRQLCLAHLIYLEAILYSVESGVGSRGSAMVTGVGEPVHPVLWEDWSLVPENPEFRERVLETTLLGDGRVQNVWTQRQPLPEPDAWFETAWANYVRGSIYEEER